MKPREFMTLGALCFRVEDSEEKNDNKKGNFLQWKFPFLFRIEK